MYKRPRAEGFGAEVKRRIMIGTYVLSHGYYDAYYLQAQKVRRMIADDFQRCFAQCDVIAGPVAPSVAWKIGAQGDDPSPPTCRHLHHAGQPGQPARHERAGRLRRGDGMPVGLQLIGNYFARKARCCTPRTRFQQATDWHRARRGNSRMSSPMLIRG